MKERMTFTVFLVNPKRKQRWSEPGMAGTQGAVRRNNRRAGVASRRAHAIEPASRGSCPGRTNSPAMASEKVGGKPVTAAPLSRGGKPDVHGRAHNNASEGTVNARAGETPATISPATASEAQSGAVRRAAQPFLGVSSLNWPGSDVRPLSHSIRHPILPGRADRRPAFASLSVPRAGRRLFQSRPQSSFEVGRSRTVRIASVRFYSSAAPGSETRGNGLEPPGASRARAR